MTPIQHHNVVLHFTSRLRGISQPLLEVNFLYVNVSNVNLSISVSLFAPLATWSFVEVCCKYDRQPSILTATCMPNSAMRTGMRRMLRGNGREKPVMNWFQKPTKAKTKMKMLKKRPVSSIAFDWR